MPVETLIDGYTFFVTDGPTEFGPTGGLYHRDARHLSRLDVRLDGAELVPMGVSSPSPSERRVTLAPEAPAVNEMGERNVAKHTEVAVVRDQTVREGAGYRETIAVHNHAATPRTVSVSVGFDADFADLFEVRGLTSGIDRSVATEVGDRRVSLSYRYRGTGGTTNELATTVRFDAEPDTLSETEARYTLELDPQDRRSVAVTVGVGDGGAPDADAFDTGDDEHDGIRASTDTDGGQTVLAGRSRPVDFPAVDTGVAAYDEVFRQAAADLSALTTSTDHGPVALAGTPWFATPFGRDALIAAYQTLPVAPELAAGTLRYLAAHQGTAADPVREEEAGKIFHEIRHGELADRRLIPHTPYYGTVDATPLWVALLAETCEWRGDYGLAADLSRSLVAALQWIVRASDDGPDGSNDPFVYYRTSETGLDHKAWKDTADSVRFADGEVAETPLAVAEVQGYAAWALRRGADLVERLDAESPTSPAAYRGRARAIERAFDEEFWLPDRSFYGLAKDGDGRIVDAMSSNVGHCLLTGTIPEGRADAVAETLLSDGLASSWGLRTMSTRDDGYSPVSYHAGGVWPHDTSFVALGLANYGFGREAERLGELVLDAASTFPDGRMPELYCGFDRDRRPVEYPAACAPQAWGAGAPYAFLRAAFGLQPDGGDVRVGRAPDRFDDSALASVRGLD